MIRVFPRKTKWTPDDELAFIGDPPLYLPPKQPVRISVAFTWDIPEGQRLFNAWSPYYSDVRLGGPAFGDSGAEFVPGRYLKEGVTITSRGCLNKCTWCFVPQREGALRELPITEGWIIQDNNLLACSKTHQDAVFDMLDTQPHSAEFKGGLDARLIRPWHVERWRDMRIGEMWLACDTKAALKPLEIAANLLADFPVSKKRCFVMVGFDGEELKEAQARLETVYSLGFLPFCQLYQPYNRKVYGKDWRALARLWSRPAAYKSKYKKQSWQRHHGERDQVSIAWVSKGLPFPAISPTTDLLAGSNPARCRQMNE